MHGAAVAQHRAFAPLLSEATSRLRGEAAVPGSGASTGAVPPICSTNPAVLGGGPEHGACVGTLASGAVASDGRA